LAKETGFTVKVSQGFGAMAWCKHWRDYHQLYFGRALLRKAYAFGIWISRDEELVWHSPGPDAPDYSIFTRLNGFESVYKIVLHEFAHVLDQAKPGDSHGDGFYGELGFLATACPYAEYGYDDNTR